MDKMQKMHKKLNRRDFLKLAAVGTVTAASGYFLYEYTPWLDYDNQAQHIRRPFDEDLTGLLRYRELIRYATLAANGHNAQAWQFAIRENAIDIYPDYSRRLPVVDPDDRELWISLGCALENLLIAARATGYAAEVVYPDTEDVLRVRLSTDIVQQNPLFDAIPLRQNTRSEYTGQPIAGALLDQLVSLPLEPGVVTHFVTNQAEMETVVEYVNQGNLNQYADKAFIDELISWLRFTKKEALASLDGLYTRSSGNPEVPRWLGEMFVADTNPQQQADADTRKLRSSPHALVISSQSEDKSTWIRTGQVYERMALMMTSLGIQSAFLNQPVEVASTRSQFQSALALGEANPQLLIRFGYGAVMPRSLRRPVEAVLV